MVYTDSEQPVTARVEDLLSRMTLADKAGLLFHPVLTMNPDGSLVEDPEHAFGRTARDMIVSGRINHFNLLGTAGPREIAQWHNRLQELAADTPLGIPVTLSTDPRHSFTDHPGTGMSAGAFSQWPEPLGLAAARDPELVRQHADAVRQEYLAVGFRVALHPQIDLATEPRWARISGTFGEDAELTSNLVTAYLDGLRAGEGAGRDGVAAMVKHFPGGGPQRDGEDPHFPYGREQIYPGGRFDYHLRPFRAAIAAGATQLMPYYGMPIGTEYEEVGFGFNRSVITELLREQLGFNGIVCTDWRLLSDATFMGETVPAKAWGVEGLTVPERILKALEAGVDQFGGEHVPELLVSLVEQGRLSEERIDISARRLLAEKFRLGLFDERRFVDPDEAERVVGSSTLRAQGRRAQERSLVLLTNPDELLPLNQKPRLWAQEVDQDLAAGYSRIAASPEDADVALLRLDAPYDVRPGLFEAFFHAGRLDFPSERLRQILDLLESVPTIVVLHLDRPAVIPEIARRAAALIVDFGADDTIVLDTVFGRVGPSGALPFQLPYSIAQVASGKSDAPQTDPEPLFAFGHGLTYRHGRTP